MLAHLTRLKSLLKAAIVLVVSVLLRNDIKHEISEFVSSRLWKQLKLEVSLSCVSERLNLLAELLIKGNIFFLVDRCLFPSLVEEWVIVVVITPRIAFPTAMVHRLSMRRCVVR